MSWVINSVAVIAGGSGYSASSYLSIQVDPNGNIETGGSQTFQVISSGGAIQSVTPVGSNRIFFNSATPVPKLTVIDPGGFVVGGAGVVAGGGGYSPSASVTVTGGTQPVTQATLHLTISGGIITGVSVVSPGYYQSGATTPAATISDSVVNATAVAKLMPFAIQGTAVETYQGRVWVANGAGIFFSAPGSFSDFSSSGGGGNFISADSFLKRAFSQLIQSNGFLYLIADSSINYISGVQTSGTPPTTTFSNQNADPQIGTPYPYAVCVFGRNIVFSNSFGPHILYGGSVQKVGTELDGVWPTASVMGTFQASSGTAVIFNRRVHITLVPIVDPLSGVTVNKMLMWDSKRWWSSSQNLSPITFVASQEINSVITCYGTDGTNILPLFVNPSNGFTKTLQTKLFDAPYAYVANKAAVRWWGLMQYYSTSSQNLTLNIDNQANAAPTWSAGATYTITGPGALGYFVTPPQAVGQQGPLVGWTLQTNAADMSVVSTAMRNEVVQYRG